MILYIDNKKVDFNNKKYKSFGKFVYELTKELRKEDRFPYKFLVNGKTIKENDIIDMKKIEIVEVLTKTERQIIFDSISHAKEQIDSYFKLFDEIEEAGKGEDYVNISEVELLEKGIFLRWFYNLLVTIKGINNLTFVYDYFDQFVADFKENLEIAEQAFDQHDYEGYMDILEHDIGDMLQFFYEESGELLKYIINDENRKRLLN